MESEFADKSNPTSRSTPNVQTLASADFEAVKFDAQAPSAPSVLSTSGVSSWHRSLNILQPLSAFQEDSGKSTFARLTDGLGSKISPKASAADDTSKETLTAAQTGFIESFTKGLVDSSRSAVKAVQVKARHVVSQNKRRYQEGEFDLDMTYITNNIIAMGFPAGDMSSGFFGFVEGLYRNHMEEVIKFFETRHKGKYKVYNLCSERLYDASLFEGKVASFPFDDHNCPPIQLIISFCHSAHTWLKQDTENVVAVHCKAGKARTGLMISSLLLFLKFSPSAEECINYYNHKRCFDGKGLVLPSQMRYVKYFERILMHFNGQNQPGRRCMLRGLRLHSCPYWVRPAITVSDHNGVLFTTKKHPRTKDLSPEDFWISAPKKGIIVFALPGEPGLTELTGDFKIHFHERQGDFYCWLNTAMMENRKTLTFSDLDWFDKRKLPSPGFQVEVVMMDYDGRSSKRPPTGDAPNKSPKTDSPIAAPSPIKNQGTHDKDELSDSETEKTGPPKVRKASSASAVGGNATPGPQYSSQTGKLTRKTEQITLEKMAGPMHFRPAAEQKRVAAGAVPVLGFDVPGSTMGSSEFKEMAADASVFTFGDEEDYDSDAIDLK